MKSITRILQGQGLHRLIDDSVPRPAPTETRGKMPVVILLPLRKRHRRHPHLPNRAPNKVLNVVDSRQRGCQPSSISMIAVPCRTSRGNVDTVECVMAATLQKPRPVTISGLKNAHRSGCPEKASSATKKRTHRHRHRRTSSAWPQNRRNPSRIAPSLASIRLILSSVAPGNALTIEVPKRMMPQCRPLNQISS